MLEADGRAEEAHREASRAAEIHDRKGNVVSAARLRERWGPEGAG
ncbi:MAG: hypothetical protein WD770_02710 [Actinomycetota bacterium]